MLRLKSCRISGVKRSGRAATAKAAIRATAGCAFSACGSGICAVLPNGVMVTSLLKTLRRSRHSDAKIGDPGLSAWPVARYAQATATHRLEDWRGRPWLAQRPAGLSGEDVPDAPGDRPVTVCSHRSGLRPALFRRRCSRALPANRDTLGGPPRRGAAPSRAPPRQAHVEGSREAERAPFGTEIDLGVDRVIGRPRDLHVARGELHRRLEARGPAGR
jgi:hypothetical protein